MIWTDCKERLPPPDYDVLVATEDFIGIGYREVEEDGLDMFGKPWVWTDPVWHADPSDCLNPCCSGFAQITHWAELPRLPNGKLIEQETGE